MISKKNIVLGQSIQELVSVCDVKNLKNPENYNVHNYAIRDFMIEDVPMILFSSEKPAHVFNTEAEEWRKNNQ